MRKYITSLGISILLICLFYIIYFVIINIPMNTKIQSDTIKKYSVDIKTKYDNISKLEIYSNQGAIQFHYYLNNENSQEEYNIFEDNYKLLFLDHGLDEIDGTKILKSYIQISFHINTSKNNSYELLFKNKLEKDYREWVVHENGVFIKTISKK